MSLHSALHAECTSTRSHETLSEVADRTLTISCTSIKCASHAEDRQSSKQLRPAAPVPACSKWIWSAGAESLSWPTNAVVSPGLSLQLHALAEPALLRALVQQSLPAPPWPPSQAWAEQASSVRSLCLMLQALTAVPALCQKALIFTAGPADFVQRLWASHLKVRTVLVPLCPSVGPLGKTDNRFQGRRGAGDRSR